VNYACFVVLNLFLCNLDEKTRLQDWVYKLLYGEYCCSSDKLVAEAIQIFSIAAV